MNSTTPPRVSPFVGVIYRLLTYIEITAIAGAGVGFVMRYSSMEGAAEILMVALSVLAAVFFLKGYAPPSARQQNDSEPKLGFFDLLGSTIVPKAGWIGCSVATVGIQFSILGLKGAAEMLMIGCAALTVALLLAGIFIVSKPERTTTLIQLVYRAVPLWLVGVWLFVNSSV